MCCLSEPKGDSGSLRTGLIPPLSSNGRNALPKGKIMTDTVTLSDGQVRLIANASDSEVGPSGRSPAQGEIGFIGLGHMGTAMAANLAAAGYRVIAYVRRPDQKRVRARSRRILNVPISPCSGPISATRQPGSFNISMA
jgi:hypothetical protein